MSIFSNCQKQKKRKETKPNIIYIHADDLGYGEISIYGQKKIQTPNIDALAKNGMLFTQHYAGAPVCAPLRYMLLSGIRKNICKGNMKIELYDLTNDITESIDVADQHPDIIAQMENIMKKEHSPAEIDRFKINQLGD